MTRTGMTCPMSSCSFYFKKVKASKVLKHFSRKHPSKWILKCGRCKLFFCRKHKEMKHHIMSCKDNIGSGCICHSSHKLKEAKFNSIKFDLLFTCMICGFFTTCVGGFNNHISEHPLDSNFSASHTLSQPYSPPNLPYPPLKKNNSGGCNDSLSFPQNDIKPVPVVSTGSLNFPLNNIVESARSNLSSKAIARHPCPECGKLFTRKRSIKNHMVVHTGERLFQCNICDYKAKRKRDLMIHLNIVHDDKRPFCCQICGQTFAILTNLKRHSVMHTGDSPFECQECGKKFKYPYSLSRHSKKKHNQNDMSIINFQREEAPWLKV